MTGLMKRIGNWFAGSARRAELERMDEVELGRVAGEVGVSVRELGDLTAEGPEAAALLPRRMRALELDVDAIARREPASLRDLQRVCSRCVDKGRCEHDLDRGLRDPGWESYCPNAHTLRALEAMARR